MKVLKPGREQTGWSTEAMCTGDGNGGGGCGAVLLVEASDLYLTFRNCRDETEEYITFRCPCCQVETDVGGVPYRVREIARTNGKRKLRAEGPRDA